MTVLLSRRSALTATVAIGVAGLLSDCSASPQSKAVATPKGEITYAIWGKNQLDTMSALARDFEAKYSGVKVNVELTPFDQYFTKLQTLASSDTMPDVFWINGPNVRLYAANDKLATIDDMVSQKLVSSSNYPKELNSVYTFNGKQYAVPKDFDTIALWYNTEIFTNAGVPAPVESWTWNDFKKAAADIKAKVGGQGIYGVVAELLQTGQGSYYNSILQAGGEVISADGRKSGYDSSASIAGLQLWRDLIASGSMPSIQQLSDTAALNWFQNGKAAMFWSGTFSVNPISKSPVANVATVAPLPRGNKRATVIHGIGNAMPAKAKNKETAEAFVAYLGGKEANIKQGSVGTANPGYLGTQDAFVKSNPTMNLQVFETAAAEYAYAYPISKNTAAWNALEKKLLVQAFDGSRPVAEVAKDLAAQMNDALAKE